MRKLRDSLKLAGLARAGELTPIYVPDPADEAMRDLVRTREDAVAMQRQARHRLAALLLRNDLRYAGKIAGRSQGFFQMLAAAGPSAAMLQILPAPSTREHQHVDRIVVRYGVPLPHLCHSPSL